MAQGLSDWEWDQLKMVAKPETVRKRFREELEYLGRFGDFSMLSDCLLTHLLLYAWKDFYRLALVCKRFHCVTKTRAYWAALAKRFFHGKIPAPILEQVNFFHMLSEEKPAYTYLQGIFKKPREEAPFIYSRDSDDICIVYPFPDRRRQEGGLLICWHDDLKKYSIQHFCSDAGSNNSSIGEPQYCEFFNYSRAKKLVWVNTRRDRSIVSVYTYCEIYDPDRNQTWYGQPGKNTSTRDQYLTDDEMMPGPLSWGVWK